MNKLGFIEWNTELSTSTCFGSYFIRIRNVELLVLYQMPLILFTVCFLIKSVDSWSASKYNIILIYGNAHRLSILQKEPTLCHVPCRKNLKIEHNGQPLFVMQNWKQATASVHLVFVRNSFRFFSLEQNCFHFIYLVCRWMGFIELFILSISK